MIQYYPIVTGSLTVNGDLIVTGTGSMSSSNAISSSYAATSSYANTFTVANTLTAQTLVVQTITSSISYITGSTRFGSSSINTHDFTGSLRITGSITQIGTNATASFGGYTGIGTTSPRQYKLAVVNSGSNAYMGVSNQGTADGDRTLRMGFGGNGSNTYAELQGTRLNIADDVNIVLQPGGGSIGIGTTNPSQKFEVVGGEIKAGRVDSSNEGGQLSFGRALDNNTSWYIDLYGNSSSPQLRFVDVDNSAVRMVLSGSNIAIGTSSPSINSGYNTLTINGPTGGLLELQSNGTTNAQIYSYSGLNIDSKNSTPIYFHTSDTERMRITSVGNVGIGTAPTGSATTNLLHVGGANAVLRVGPYYNTGGDRDFIELIAHGANTMVYSYNEDFSFVNPYGNANITGSNVNICGTGNINFRTTAGAGTSLNVYAANAGGANANLYMECPGVFGAGFFADRASSTFRGWCGGSSQGVSLAGNGTSWGSYSDERMKDIIEPIENATDKINTLRTVIGKYKTDEDDKRRVFLIAQDVEKVLPEAVFDDKSEDKMLSLQYTDIIPLLVASVKELSTKLEEANSKITALEAK